jgi:hypothetical protein
MNKKNLIGKIFNKLVVQCEFGRDSKNNIAWLCKCDCGNMVVLSTRKLTQHINKSCGQCQKIIATKDYYIYKTKNGKEFIFDQEDLSLVEQYVWHLSRGYPQTNIKTNGIKTTLKLHNLILNTSSEQIVDHINGDPTDNRRVNLRRASLSENMWNTRKTRLQCSSKFKGVSYKKANNKWCARIKFKHKTINIGYFNNETDAAIAYNNKALELFQEFAVLNIIPHLETIDTTLDITT